MGKKYFKEECDDLIKELCENKTIEQIGIIHKRTENGVYCKIIQIISESILSGKNINEILPARLKLNRLCEEWNNNEYRNLIKEIKENKTINEIAIIHERNKFCIDKQIKVISKGLKKENANINTIISATNEELDEYFKNQEIKKENKKIEILNNISNPLVTTHGLSGDSQQINENNVILQSNQGKPWSSKEDKQLTDNLNQNYSLFQISQIHGRTISGISKRIKKINNTIKQPSYEILEQNLELINNKNLELVIEVNYLKGQINAIDCKLNKMMKIIENITNKHN